MWYNLVEHKTIQKELAVIYRQEIIQDVHMFISQPKAKFYSTLFYILI